ncbi:MAG TPA: aminotransferase class I/II-fold pyridoxal phosphate-dependent enzyme [Actinomycetota bacterium]|jgi:aromatic-L-amino-acid decarboxylase|nr:aminotransferase class I/II-fold pyridoxal phosphate-dependent enzyme [Actinomycetota bacterium]
MGERSHVSPYPLEPPGQEMRSMGERALELLIRFIEGLPSSPAIDLDGVDEVVDRLREAPLDQGRPLSQILDDVGLGAAKAFNTTGPGYLAFIPGGGLYAAAVADFLACGLNRFVNVWHAAPAFAQIEWTIIRWLDDLFGLPEGSGGILTSGGSMANFSAIVTARRALLGEEFLDGTLYFSDQTHASVSKAAILAGFPGRCLRTVPTSPDLAVDVQALREMVQKDRADGLRPFFVVANAGTTNTGRVDPIAEIGAVAREEELWLHTDAAYGGFFQLTERGRGLFRGIESSDSITLDPHKGMFLPYGTGSLLVRDRRQLRDAHHVGAAYLQDLFPEGDIPNFADSSPELSRDFRGLRVWLPLQLHGVDAFRATLDEKLDLTSMLYEALRSSRGFELPWEPDLTVVPFRYRPRTGDPEEFNRRLLERINASRRVFLSSTMIDGRFVLRVCIVSFRTHRDRIEEAIDIIRSSAVDLDA